MFNSGDTIRIVGSTAVGLVCWGIGYFGYPSLLMVVFLAINVIKAKLYGKRERRQRDLQLLTIKEKETLEAQLRDLPAWVQFPDTERVEWVNKIVFQLWPYVGEYVRSFVIHQVAPQIKASLPGPFQCLKFEEVDMGSIPPRIVGVKTYMNTGRDKVIADFDLAYAGDCQFIISVGAFEAGLRSVMFKGKLRLTMSPLLARPPLVAGVRCCFMDDPDVDFDLTGIGELAELPGLMGAIRNVITMQLRERCVTPNEIAVSLTEEVDMSKLLFPEPDGVMIVHAIEARDLEEKDFAVKFVSSGKSDAYTVITVGSQVKETKVIESNLNPVWNEYFQFIVDQAADQKISISVFDKDVGDDEYLGFCEYSTSNVKALGTSDTWISLERVKKGEIHLKMQWFYLSPIIDQTTNVSILPNQNLCRFLLLLYIDSVEDLCTLPRIDTVHPIFQKKYSFWVRDPSAETLEIEVLDNESGKSLGDCVIPLNLLLAAENLEIKQKGWPLSKPSSGAKIIMTVRLRVLSSEEYRNPGKNGSEDKKND